jgi:hypothetical protein
MGSRTPSSILGKRFRLFTSKQHAACNAVGLTLTAIATGAIWVSKDAWGKPHLATYHAWAGAAAIVVNVLVGTGVRGFRSCGG